MPRGGRLEFGFSWGKGDGARRSEGEPFRVLVVGDFGGRTSRGESRPVEHARALRVGVDSLDDTIARIAPELSLTHPSGVALSVGVRSMEDFHPDALFGALDFFEPMRRLRQQLRDPRAFAATLPAPGLGGGAGSVSGESDASAVERLLGRRMESRQEGAIDGWVRQVVAPHVVPGPTPQHAQMQSAAAVLMTELMRGLLHDRSFQRLEATWRAVDFLVRRLDEDGGAEIWILDVTREELAADLGRGGPGLRKLLVGPRLEGEGASLVSAAMTFGPQGEDVELAMGMARIAMEAGAPLVAGADARQWEGVGADDARAWKEARQRPEAQWLGLALPGFLLRMPYGVRTDAIESFPFEEQGVPPEHARYLWGDGSTLIALLIGQACTVGLEEGPMQVDGLPVHAWSGGADVQQTPCAETWLDEQAVARWIEAGLMPVRALRGKDCVRVDRVQSVRGDSLGGRW